MSRKQVKAIIVLVLSFIIIFGNDVSVQAAIPSISTSNYIKAYVLSTGNNTPVYTDSSLWVRGTASPKTLDYRRRTFRLSPKCKFLSTGGEDPITEYSRDIFENCYVKQPDLGFGFLMKIKNGKVVAIYTMS